MSPRTEETLAPLGMVPGSGEQAQLSFPPGEQGVTPKPLQAMTWCLPPPSRPAPAPHTSPPHQPSPRLLPHRRSPSHISQPDLALGHHLSAKDSPRISCNCSIPLATRGTKVPHPVALSVTSPSSHRRHLSVLIWNSHLLVYTFEVITMPLSFDEYLITRHCVY